MPLRYAFVCCFNFLKKNKCESPPVVRIDRHLIEVHSLIPKSPAYLEARRNCTRILNPKFGQERLPQDDGNSSLAQDQTSQGPPSLPSTSSASFEVPPDDGYVQRFVRRLVFLSDDHESNPKPINCSERNIKCVLQELRETQLENGHQASPGSPLDFIDRAVLQDWLEARLKNSVPGTLNTRVCILKKFLRFVIRENGGISSELDARLNACLADLDEGSTRLSRLSRKRKFLNEANERSQLLKKEHTQNFQDSDHVRETLAKLAALGGTDEIPTSSFAIQARNVLLTLLLFRSAQRGGAFAGLTMGGFRDGESIRTNNEMMIVLSVTHHKTFNFYGSAKLSIEPWLYELMESYRNYLRPLARDFDVKMEEDNSPFFLTRNSTILDNGYTSKAIVSAWRRARVPREFISITNFRKSVVSILHGEMPEVRGELSSLMTHRLSTAEAYYKNTCMPVQQAANTATIVRDCIVTRIKPPSLDATQPDEASTPERETVPATVVSNCIVTRSKKTPSLETPDEDSPPERETTVPAKRRGRPRKTDARRK